VSLVPALKLGLWNAWVLVLPLVVISVFLTRILLEREPGESPDLSNKEKAVFAAHHVIFLASIVYSVFLPLKLKTLWLYGGILIYVPGILIEILALQNFYTAPLDKPVTGGIYSISRHPMYVGNFLINTGISMACLSWVFLLVAIMTIFLESGLADMEERWCLEKYGEAYKLYMNSTPKWIGIPK
jgi:protein-S-isoprenylcysteine O-methyltransferase Ste14